MLNKMKYSRNRPSKICGIQPLSDIWSVKTDHFNFFWRLCHTNFTCSILWYFVSNIRTSSHVTILNFLLSLVSFFYKWFKISQLDQKFTSFEMGLGQVYLVLESYFLLQISLNIKHLLRKKGRVGWHCIKIF